MSDDHTIVDIIAWPKLIRRLHQSTDPNAVEAGKRLASMLRQPDRRIGTVLDPKGRGGTPDWLADQRAERDRAYRDAAVAEYGTEHLTPGQAEKLARKVNRLVDDAQAGEAGTSGAMSCAGLGRRI